MHTKSNQQGFTHVLLVLIAVVVIAAIGFAGWRVMESNKSKDSVNTTADSKSDAASTAASSAELKAAEDECLKQNIDKDLCKAFSELAEMKQFKLTSTSVSDGNTTTAEYVFDNGKSYSKILGDIGYEIIVIGEDTYTKGKDYWWKQPKSTATATDTVPTEYASEDDYKLDVTSKENNQPISYIRLGEEACDKLTCIKFEMKDPATPDTKSYVWVDTKEHKVRRMQTIDTSATTDIMYVYDNVSVDVPTPVKELQAGQYVLPGSDDVSDFSAGLQN